VVLQDHKLGDVAGLGADVAEDFAEAELLAGFQEHAVELLGALADIDEPVLRRAGEGGFALGNELLNAELREVVFVDVRGGGLHFEVHAALGAGLGERGRDAVVGGGLVDFDAVHARLHDLELAADHLNAGILRSLVDAPG
jgi:hypothetical protein